MPSKSCPFSDLGSDAQKGLFSTMALLEYGAGEHLIDREMGSHFS